MVEKEQIRDHSSCPWLSFEFWGWKTKLPSHTPDQLNPFCWDGACLWLKSLTDSECRPVWRNARGCCKLWPSEYSAIEPQLVVKSWWALRTVFFPLQHYPKSASCFRECIEEQQIALHIQWVTVVNGIWLFWWFGEDLDWRLFLFCLEKETLMQPLHPEQSS